LEDYCPIFVAILGGFLQQLFGPKKILIAAGIPNFISWILIAIDPTSLYFLLGSRLLAGFSNGLLTGNVYMADISPSKYITSFKSIEVTLLIVIC
jgi:MFS family permease